MNNNFLMLNQYLSQTFGICLYTETSYKSPERSTLQTSCTWMEVLFKMDLKIELGWANYNLVSHFRSSKTYSEKLFEKKCTRAIVFF